MSMPLTLRVSKFLHPVHLSYNEDGLRIEGDYSAGREYQEHHSCLCIPSPAVKPYDPTLLPIPMRNLIQAEVNERTRILHIDAIIPRDFSNDQSVMLFVEFAYKVEDEQVAEAQTFCSKLMEDAYKDIVLGRRIKVLINPFGGQGKAKTIFESVQPIFASARCKIDVTYTEYQGHAIQVAKEMDVGAYDAVVTVSGDGIIHEVLNGFMQRPDADKAAKIPIGVIPGGSGNALSVCLLGEQAGFDPVHTALQVIKGQPMALDLCSITYDDHSYYSFLSQNYGITAYADLATEPMRWMGDARIVLGLFQQVLGRHSYPAKMELLLAESDKDKIKTQYRQARTNKAPTEIASVSVPSMDQPVPSDWITVEGDVSTFLASKAPWLARGMLSHPCALPNDGLIDILLVRGNTGVIKQLDMFAKIEKGRQIDMDAVEYYKAKAFRFTPQPRPGQTAYVAIDGEHAPIKPFQVQVHPHLASVLSLHGNFVDTGI